MEENNLGLNPAGQPRGIFPYHDFIRTRKIPWPCVECKNQMYAIGRGNTVECDSCNQTWILSKGIWYHPVAGKNLNQGNKGWYILSRGPGGGGGTVIPKPPSMRG